MVATPPTASKGKPRAFAFLLAGLSAVGPFSVDAYLPSMPAIARTLGVSQVAVQHTLTAYMVPFALMTVWHGAISDAIGRRWVVLTGLALFGIASALCACAGSLEGLLLFRATQGLVAGAGMVVGRAIVRDLFGGAAAQRMMSHVAMAFAIAPAVAPVIGGWLEFGFGWRSVFLFLVVYAMVTWLWCWRVLPETLPQEARQPLNPVFLLRSYRRVLMSPRFVGVCLAFTFNFAGLFIYVASAPVFLMKHLHLAETEFLWLFGPATVGLMTGAWASARLAGRLTGSQTVWFGYGIMSVAAAGNVVLNLLAPPGLPWSVAPILFYSFGMALAFPSLTLMALDLFPEQRGLAASCQSFVQTTGAAATAAIIAPLLWGSLLSFAVGAATLLAAGFACFLLSDVLPGRRARNRPSPPQE